MPTTLHSLTGLRAVAALVVFASHAALVPATQHLVAQGRIGVSFFFALSGFVLMWSRDERQPAHAFWWNRFARIYPAYIVAWVAAIALTLALGSSNTLFHAVTGGLLLQSWGTSPGSYFAWNAPAWSLSCEVFFYFTFPFWAWRLATCSPRTRRRLVMSAVGAIFLIGVVAQIVSPGGDGVVPDRTTTAWFVRTFPPVRMLEFFLGAALAVEIRNGWRSPISLRTAAILVALTYIAAGFVITWWTSIALTIIPILLLIASAAHADLTASGRGTILGSRLAVWGGALSYCFYLTHQLVIHLIDALGARDVTMVFKLPAVLLLSTAVAAVLHYGVEKPANRALRRRGSRPTPPEPVVA